MGCPELIEIWAIEVATNRSRGYSLTNDKVINAELPR